MLRLYQIMLNNWKGNSYTFLFRNTKCKTQTQTNLEYAPNSTYAFNCREFNKTKADAADPLKAATVYSNIVKAVNEAEEAAKRAIKAAEDSIRIVSLGGTIPPSK